MSGVLKCWLVAPALLAMWPFPNSRICDRIGSALIDWAERPTRAKDSRP